MGSHSVTCHPTQVNTPCLNHSQTCWYSIFLPQRDGRLSWPGWPVTLMLTYQYFPIVSSRMSFLVCVWSESWKTCQILSRHVLCRVSEWVWTMVIADLSGCNTCMNLVHREKTSHFLYMWHCCQMSSDFRKFWQKHAPRNLKQTHNYTADHISVLYVHTVPWKN